MSGSKNKLKKIGYEIKMSLLENRINILHLYDKLLKYVHKYKDSRKI